jgi:hypothetical protein
MMKKWSKGQNGTLSLWLLSPLASRKTVSETVNAAYIKKTLAGSLTGFKPKGPGLLFQDRFLSWVNSQSSHCHLCPRVPGVERHHDDPPPTLFIGYYPSGLFFLSKSEVRGGWPLNCPGQLQDELVGVMLTSAEEEFATAFWRWYECC